MEKEYSKVRNEQARAETRRKIELGGLIVKSGLHQEAKDVVLGALISAAEALAKEPGSRTLFQSKGMKAFLKA